MNLLYPQFDLSFLGKFNVKQFSHENNRDDRKENQASSETCITGFGRIRGDRCFCKVRWLPCDGRSNEVDVASFCYAHGFPQSFLVVKVKHLNSWLSPNWSRFSIAKTLLGPQLRSDSPASKIDMRIPFKPNFFQLFKLPNLKHFPTERTEDGHSLNACSLPRFRYPSWGS